LKHKNLNEKIVQITSGSVVKQNRKKEEKVTWILYKTISVNEAMKD
jgi:hypothetical protein